MCQGFGGINSSIDRGVGALNLNIADQAAQSRLQAQELASQQQACKILYCWFSQVNNKSFTPQMIKANEWLLANVYASEITDARVSKLKAICKYEEKTQPVQTVPPSVPEQPTPLIDIGLINDTGTGNKTEPTDSDNKRERRTNNRSGND